MNAKRSAWNGRAMFAKGALALAVSLALGAAEAFGSGRTGNAGTANWNVPGNWTPSGVPGSGNAAVINNTGTAVVIGCVVLWSLFGASMTIVSEKNSLPVPMVARWRR